MGKVRKFRARDVGVPCEHPDGGTARLLPLDVTRGAQLKDALEAIEYEVDESGNVRIEDGQPVKKDWQKDSDRIAARIGIIRKFCVVGVDDFVDADNPTDEGGSPRFIPMTDTMIESWMAEVSARPIEREVPLVKWDETEKKLVPERDEAGKIKTEIRTVPANEPVFSWVMEKSSELGSVGAVEEKNSSSTPSTPTALAAQ